MKSEYIWINFVASVWLLIAYAAISFFANVHNASALDDAYGPFSVKVALWPAVVGGLELVFWFRPFRYRESGARVMAGFMGIMLLLQPVFVTLIVADLYGGSIGWLGYRTVYWPAWWLCLYVALSHMAFAFFGRERRW